MKEKGKIVFLGGGTGTPKLIQGFRRIINEENITVIANTADDITLYGLYISPDVDTYLYLFSNLLDTKKFWGIEGDSYYTYSFLKKFDKNAWFTLGDKDLAIHLFRTQKLQEEKNLSEITTILANRLNIKAKILPCTDNHIETRIVTKNGHDIHFQEFWVREKANLSIQEIYVKGIENAIIPDDIFSEIEEADKIILGPSNPITSIGPIISIKKIRQSLKKNKEKCIAISPIVGDRAISGPTCQFLATKNKNCSIKDIISLYEDFITCFFIDESDKNIEEQIKNIYPNLDIRNENIVMKDISISQNLAKTLLKV
ncbi:MAG: 2-phospho-L-lactate transferase [Candidatus Heimdallarchaeaceae archaeon]